MDKTVLIYDLEILNAIPPKESSDFQFGITYCNGWRDFHNMGISCCGWTYLDSDPICFEWENIQQRLIFEQALMEADIIAGFNSAGFDDHLLEANGVATRTGYDILYECRLAAYGSTDYQLQPEDHSYRLADIVSANGMEKTGRGDLAPIWWQSGDRDRTRLYCLNDIKIERDTLSLLLAGKLVNPNTGQMFKARPLDVYSYSNS
ncbi:MAG TPA: hypothetical protein DD761_03530 [Cyanobacteria bacterium UBA11691]|nr:hypothetical protein [Cyanobacteria bacterium UBA11691]